MCAENHLIWLYFRTSRLYLLVLISTLVNVLLKNVINCIYPIMGGCQNRILIFFKTTKMIYSVRLKSKQPFYIWKKACHCASRLGTQTSSKFTNYSLNQGMQETSQRWADKNSLMLLAPHRFTFASLKSSPNQGMAHFLERCSIRTLCGSKRKNSIAVWSVCGSLSAEHNNLL